MTVLHFLTLNLKLIKSVLTHGNFSVSTATNANEALDLLKVSKPKLILMDIQMPDIDGLELTRLIKSDASNDGIIIIAITAYASSENEEKAMSAGCSGYIIKPIDTENLLKTINQNMQE